VVLFNGLLVKAFSELTTGIEYVAVTLEIFTDHGEDVGEQSDYER
jgi:hypothetical protein